MQSSTLISKSNIFTQIHANIYNLINNRSNVPDPVDSFGNRKFVYVREPLYLSTNFKGFPFIVVPNADYSQLDNQMFSGTKAREKDDITIIVMTQDKDSDTSGDPSGASQLDNISNSVLQTMNDVSNRAMLRTNGLSNIKVDSTSYEWTEINGKMVFRREINISFSGFRVIA